jgi:hypothetical protein
MRATHSIAALLLVAQVSAQICTNTVHNMSACPLLNGMSTNASSFELVSFDQQMQTIIPMYYTQLSNQIEITNTSDCTAHVHAYFCAQLISTSDMFKSCFPPEHQLKPCYQDCQRILSCFPPDTPSICVDDGKLASNRECIGIGWPYVLETTPPATTTTPPATTSAIPAPALITSDIQLMLNWIELITGDTSDAKIRELSTRLPIIMLVLIASYIF